MTPSFGIEKNVINDDNIFTASCINFVVAIKIQWPRSNKSWLPRFHSVRAELDLLMKLSSKSISLGIIPPVIVGLMGKKNVLHEQHNDGGHVGCSSIWTSRIYGHIMMLTSYTSQNPQKLTTILWHTYKYFEYLLGNSSYMGEEMFVMYHIGRHELMLGIDLYIIKMCNKMHASFKLMVGWSVGGFKCK
jgi:hypothetical protein